MAVFFVLQTSTLVPTHKNVLAVDYGLVCLWSVIICIVYMYLYDYTTHSFSTHDSRYAQDADEAQFVSATNRKSAIIVSTIFVVCCVAM